MATSSRESIIQVSAAIARLRAEAARIKEELKQHEGQLDQLLRTDGASLSEVLGSAGRPSLNQRIIELLDSAVDKQFTSEDVAAYFPSANMTSIRSALARLADQNKIVRAGRGLYQSKAVPLVPRPANGESN